MKLISQGILTILGGVGAAGGAVLTFAQLIYPELKDVERVRAENTVLTARVDELRTDKAVAQKQVLELTAASASASSDRLADQNRANSCEARLGQALEVMKTLRNANSELTILADSSNRCAPYVKTLDDFRDELAGGKSLGIRPDPERRAELATLIAQQQRTVDLCISSKP